MRSLDPKNNATVDAHDAAVSSPHPQ